MKRVARRVAAPSSSSSWPSRLTQHGCEVPRTRSLWQQGSWRKPNPLLNFGIQNLKRSQSVPKRHYSMLHEIELVGALEGSPDPEEAMAVQGRLGAVTVSHKNWPLSTTGEVLLETGQGTERTLARVLGPVSARSFQFRVQTSLTQMRISPGYCSFQLAGFDKLNVVILEEIERASSDLLSSLPETIAEDLWQRFHSEGKTVILLEDVIAALWPQVSHLTITPTKIAPELYAAHRILNENFVYFHRVKEVFSVRALEQKEQYAYQDKLLDLDSKEHLAFLIKMKRRIAANVGLPPLQSPIFMHNIKQIMTTADIQAAETSELEWSESDLWRMDSVRLFSLTKVHRSSVNPRVAQTILFPLGYRSKTADAFTFLWHTGYVTEFDNPHCMSYLDEHPAVDMTPNESVASPLSFETLEREDMSKHTVFTIDDDETTEVDDGISVNEPHLRKTQGDWVYVHIADPTHLLTPGSEVDMYSRQRVSSVYLPESIIRMMPESFYQQFSLEPNRTNSSLTFAAKIAPDGAIQEYRIFPSVIKNICRLNYHMVDDVLTGSDKTKLSSADEEKILYLNELAKRRNAYRVACGASSIMLPTPDIKVSETILGRHVVVEASTEHLSAARELVAELMITANAVAADYTRKHGIPVPYRHQPAPIIPANFEDEMQGMPDVVRSCELVRHMQGAGTSLSPLGHYSLALPAYLQVTSPIRRYNDVLAHYQIKSHIKRRPLPFTLQELQSMLPHLTDTAMKVKDIQKASENMWVLHYLQQTRWENPYRRFKASIIGIDSVPDNIHKHFEARVHFEELGWMKKVYLWRPIESPPEVGQKIEFQINAVVPAGNFLSVKEKRL